MTKVNVTNIDWDIDAWEAEDIELPEAIDGLEIDFIETDDDDEDALGDAIVETLTNAYGFCINGLVYEEVFED